MPGTPPSSLFVHVLRRTLPLTLAVLVLVCSVTIVWTWRDAEQRMAQRHAELTELVSDRVGDQLHSIGAQITALASNDLLVNSLIDIEARDGYLTTFFRSLEVVGGKGAQISLTDYRGRVIVSNLDGAELQFPVEEWADEVFDATRSYQRLDERGLLMAVPVRYDGSVEGALLVELDAGRVAGLFDLSTFAIAAILIGPAGDVIFSSMGDLVEIGTPLAKLDLSDWYSVVHAIPRLEGVGLVTAERQETVLAALYQSIRLIGFAFAVVVIVTAIGIAVAAAIVSTEVRRLSGALDAVGESGNLDARITADGPHEMRVLTGSFNQMLEALGATTTSRSYLESVISSIGEMLLVVDLDGSLRTANPRARQFLESRADAANVDLPTALGLEVSDPFLDPGSDTNTTVCTYEAATGGETHVRWRRSLLHEEGPNERMSGMIIIGVDITSQYRMTEDLRGQIARAEALEEELREMALTDALTGLPNRRAFKDRLDEAIANSDRHGQAFALAYVDVDHFKAINDTYGHDMGDEALQALGDTIRNHNRVGDVPFRLGGEEFAVLLSPIDPDAVEMVADRLREAIADTKVSMGATVLRVTASVGAVIRYSRGWDAASCMKHADAALYAAKAAGSQSGRGRARYRRRGREPPVTSQWRRRGATSADLTPVRDGFFRARASTAGTGAHAGGTASPR